MEGMNLCLHSEKNPNRHTANTYNHKCHRDEQCCVKPIQVDVMKYENNPRRESTLFLEIYRAN